MMVVGLDLSINSTGVATDDGRFYIIPSKMTKKMTKYMEETAPLFTYFPYNKADDLNSNIKNLGSNIRLLLTYLKPDLVIIESPAFNAVGRVSDLSVLNGYVRCICDDLHLNHIAVPPTSVKKQFCGNGFAPKDLMVETFINLYPNFRGLDLKIDDVADSYALAVYKP